MKASDLVRELITTSIDAVRPEIFIPQTVIRKGDIIEIGGETCDLTDFGHIYVISVGKAAVGMAEAIDRILSGFITAGIVLTKIIPPTVHLDSRWQVMRGGHPLPNEGSVHGAGEILSLLEQANANDLVLFLISGGGSALMTAPIGGLDLETMRTFSDQILRCGADIKAFNILRKHLDGAKGGRLAQAAAPARQITIILSDVVGSPVESIASGPTVPDPSSYKDALKILEQYSGENIFPETVLQVLREGAAGAIPETLKAGDPAFTKSQVIIAAENRTAAHAAAARAKGLGYDAAVLNTALTGEASEIGALLPSFFSEMRPGSVRVFGGETTVRVKGNGVGGRNQETALASVRAMAEHPGCILVTLATDGEDGTSDAAGAIVTSETLEEGISHGCLPEDYLRDNDSRNYFEKTGGLIQTGPSGTNVNDLVFLIRPHEA